MFDQKVSYNQLAIPKKHKRVIEDQNMNFWNELGKIDLAFKNITIHVEHFIVYPQDGYYSIDVKVTSDNLEAEKHIEQVYKKYYIKPLLLVSESIL
jgi:hypothetical protein